jgi:hypothetical protein
MRELIRHILKENRIQQSLKQVIENGNIFDAADLVGGIPTLKKIFKGNPEMSSLFEKLTGTITFYYPVVAYGDIKFPLDYEIIGRHSNIPRTNYWPEINVLYDENKLTPEENEDFKSIIKYLYDEAQHSAFKSKFDDGRLFNTNYFAVKEINGENIDLFGGWDFSLSEVEDLHDKFYGGNQSINESERDAKKLFKVVKMIMEDMILPEYDHLICSYEITSNGDLNIPEVVVTLIGGYGTKLWPVTQGIRQMYLNVLEEISKEIENYTGVVISVRGEQTPKCKDKENIYLRESESEDKDYSPAGKEITPNHIVVHKSNPMFRDKIMENGLKVRAGECYKVYVGYGVKCKPAIFATNSTNKRAWFDSTYDDDIWFIDTTMIPDVKWFKDRHFESRSKHIVTFQDIPKEAITLKYEGTGSSEDILNSWPEDSPNKLQESIKRILREDSLKNDLMESEEKQAKYLSILKDLVEPFKKEDCVCNIGVYYDTEDDMYTVTLEVGMKELRGKSNNSFVRDEYVRTLRRDIKTTVKDYLPIQNVYVSSIATPSCGSERWWNKSINESSIKEKSLIKLIEKDGLYDLIEMTGLDFNQVRSLIKQIDNPKEILKQYIREFVLEKGGSTGDNYGSIFAVQIPLSDTKYVEDILVHDEDSIAVEMWEYHLDEYGHREQKDQYLTTINNLTNEELLSIISWMMETNKGGYWD